MKEIFKKNEIGYLSSNLGRILVPKSGVHKEHFTYGTRTANNYMRITYDNKTKYVHDLVYRAFYPDTDKDYHIHHKNGDTTDNRLENLIALSPDEHNEIHKKLGKYDKNCKSIIQLDMNNNFIRKWKSAVTVESELGFPQSNIVHCLKGKYKHAYEYKWIYENV